MRPRVDREALRRSRRRRRAVQLARQLRLALLLACAMIFLAYQGLLRFYPYLYRPQIEHAAAEFHLDPLLVASIIRVESNFRPEAHSAVGAVGLMQMMPATATWAGQRLAVPGAGGIAALEQPALNIRIGCWYLRYLLDRHHDLDAVLAAYNGGEGNIPRWRAPGATNQELAITYPETRQFLQRCHWTYRVYRFLYGGHRWPWSGRGNPNPNGR